MIKVIEALYKEPRFQVEIEGVSSEWKEQKAGIRQGCPLSPYLFIIYMTVMFSDVKMEVRGLGLKYRVTGANFDEVLFADDTICISTNTRAMNRMLSAIERIGKRSGMRLNKAKCEALQFNQQGKIVFQDKTPVRSVEESKYLGCVLRRDNNIIKEVRGRIREAATVLRKMHVFWRHSNCTVRFKLIVLNAILYAKVLYGLESAELPITATKALDVFQLKCLRKILKMTTTFITRSNTNEEVFKRANSHLKQGEKIIPLSEIYQKRKTKLFYKVVQSEPQDPIRSIAFQSDSMKPRIFTPRRVGRPKAKWTKSECERAWKSIQDTTGQQTPYQEGSEIQGAAIRRFVQEQANKK